MSIPFQHVCRSAYVLLLLGAFIGASPVQAQSYFDVPVERTGNNATVIVPASAVVVGDTASLDPGDEIGVFSEEGQCVGASVWTGENLAITIWGNDEFREGINGLRAEEQFTFRVWRASTDREIASEDGHISVSLATTPSHYRTEPTYAPNAIYLVERMLVQPPDTKDVTLR